METNDAGLGPTLAICFPVTSFEDCIPKYSPDPRYWGLGLHFGGRNSVYDTPSP